MVQGLKKGTWFEEKMVKKDTKSGNRNDAWSKGYLKRFFPQNNGKFDLVSTESHIMTNQDQEA